MPKIKKNKTLISDFDYRKKLEKLRKEIPNIAHNLFPLFVTSSIHLLEGDEPAYWTPKSIKELEKHFNDKIDTLEERYNFDTEEAYVSSGGTFIKLHVESGNLVIETGVQFGYFLV